MKDKTIQDAELIHTERVLLALRSDAYRNKNLSLKLRGQFQKSLTEYHHKIPLYYPDLHSTQSALDHFLKKIEGLAQEELRLEKLLRHRRLFLKELLKSVKGENITQSAYTEKTNSENHSPPNTQHKVAALQTALEIENYSIELSTCSDEKQRLQLRVAALQSHIADLQTHIADLQKSQTPSQHNSKLLLNHQ